MDSTRSDPRLRERCSKWMRRTPVAYMRTWDTQLYSATWPIRVLTTLLMLFAGASLFIAAIGQYAVVSFDMRRRVREVGLRMALGASSRQVLTRVIREGLTLTAIGLAVGFPVEPGGGHNSWRRAVRNHGDGSCDLCRSIRLAFSGFASCVLSPGPAGGAGSTQ